MSLRIYGNRQVKTLPGLETRPTLGRVREAVFNIWQGYIEGCQWLDLCAGSGSMGAEALCRGAKSAIAIDKSEAACTIIRENWQLVVKADQQFQIIRGDVVGKLPTLAGQQFDRIYFDPPYASELYEPVLNAIATLQILAPDGELAVEHSPEMQRVELLPPWEICRQKVYGNTGLTFYHLTTIGDR
ncbi:16S rRNA (guanine(966)-N(2))-methyltransferase RsmD [Oscillatoriales cyanobacterium USR001]|nr:16S rRNA (guanine(966)-N(2))-methyltransferase RsmD [Oscillatoriales cyanobacterium USR001]